MLAYSQTMNTWAILQSFNLHGARNTHTHTKDHWSKKTFRPCPCWVWVNEHSRAITVFTVTFCFYQSKAVFKWPTYTSRFHRLKHVDSSLCQWASKWDIWIVFTGWKIPLLQSINHTEMMWGTHVGHVFHTNFTASLRGMSPLLIKLKARLFNSPPRNTLTQSITMSAGQN